MSGIGGSIRQQTSDYGKKVGLFEGNVIAVNPSIEEYKELLGIELKEESKAVEYLGVSRDENTTLRVDFWLEESKNKEKMKVTFFLEDKVKENKDGTKKQYINSVGVCSWAADENDLPTWFKGRDYREARVGEEELYNFLRTWLGKLDYRHESTVLEIGWKTLMKGNVSDLKAQVGGEYATPVVALATVKTVEKDGEVKEYQNVYNKAFLSNYSLKQFRLVDYDKSDVQTNLKRKQPKELKAHERFVINVTGEYGCKDFFILKDMKEYDPSDNIAASDAVISDDGADY